MEVKSKSKIDELAKSGNLKEAIKEANNSSINMFNEGIRRVDLHKIDNNNRQPSEANGFLVIDSGNKEGDNKHIALKAKADTFWTISASNDGTELNIGKFKIRETKIEPIIKFKDDKSLTLYKPLEVNELKSVSKTKDNIIRGIATSGFKGFKNGTVKADGHWHTILEIPKEGFGKYKVEAWVVNKQGKGMANLEYTFVFFSDKYPKEISKETFNGVKFFTRQWLKLSHWFLKNRQDYIVYKTDKITWNRIFQEASKLEVKATRQVVDKNKQETNKLEATPQDVEKDKQETNKLEATPQDADKGKRKERVIQLKTRFTPKNCKIYYSIERIWEGSDWINVDIEQLEKENQQLEEQPIQ